MLKISAKGVWIGIALSAIFVHVLSMSDLPTSSTRTPMKDNTTQWKWICVNGKTCKKLSKNANNAINKDLAVSLEVCKMFCSKNGLLWPLPRGKFSLGSLLGKVNILKMSVLYNTTGNIGDLLEAAVMRFKNIVLKTMPQKAMVALAGRELDVFLDIENFHLREFSLKMDESYHLNVSLAGKQKINATITAANFFGARHGLETLTQLFVYDEREQHPMIVINASIEDSPRYPYRGFLLDTARNYFPIASIKRTIDTMATVKLNSFHWHITDSQSFPFVSQRKPNMSLIGAYSPSKVYTMEMIRDISLFALARGIRIVPELDTPAHVAEGWQGTGLIVCEKAEPWELFCGAPPCGQLNPIEDEIYNYLQDLYEDIADSFITADMVHMGNDEVNERCWRSNHSIEKFMKGNFYFHETSFIEMWNYFLMKAHDRVLKVFRKRIPLIIWSSELTESIAVDEYIDKEEYIIQVWNYPVESNPMRRLTEKGYKIIISSMEELYLDCGFGYWNDEESQCFSYVPWQNLYQHNPMLAVVSNLRKKLVLGSEASLWSEKSDAGNLDSRVWPRLGALAERLWTDPTTSWREAQQRMLHLKDRLTRLGIHTEAQQPEWCYQNEGNCHPKKKTNRLQFFQPSLGSAPEKSSCHLLVLTSLLVNCLQLL